MAAPGDAAPAGVAGAAEEEAAALLPQSPAKWGYTQRARGEQSKLYVTQLKQHIGVAAHGLEPEERRARHEAVLHALFAGSDGVPDPSLWDVSQPPDAAKFKFKYNHPNLRGGPRTFGTLVEVARELGNAVYTAQQAPMLLVGETSQTTPEEPNPAGLDGTRALEQVQQIVAVDGAAGRRAPRRRTARPEGVECRNR